MKILLLTLEFADPIFSGTRWHCDVLAADKRSPPSLTTTYLPDAGIPSSYSHAGNGVLCRSIVHGLLGHGHEVLVVSASPLAQDDAPNLPLHLLHERLTSIVLPVPTAKYGHAAAGTRLSP